MMFTFLNDLCESRLISSKTSLKDWKPKKLAEVGYLYFLGLRVLLSDESSKEWTKKYCKRAGEPTDFLTWRTSQNDLYALLYGLSVDPDDTHIDGNLDNISISASPIRNWLRHVATHESLEEDTQKLFVRLDAMFNITNSQMKSLRRIIMNWEDTDSREQENTVNKLIQLIPSNSEILSKLKKLEYKEDKIKESASSGATGASNVATVVGGLGAGFESNETGSWRSVYGEKKKPIVIRRVSKSRRFFRYRAM